MTNNTLPPAVVQRYFDSPYYVTPSEPVGQEAVAVITSPSQAPKSRPFANAAPLPIAATIALETIGPMPGTVISRSHAGS
jgi:hypothetical protein